MDISADGFLSLMMESGELREDIKLPEGDMGSDISGRFEQGEDMLVCIAKVLVTHGNQ